MSHAPTARETLSHTVSTAHECLIVSDTHVPWIRSVTLIHTRDTDSHTHTHYYIDNID